MYAVQALLRCPSQDGGMTKTLSILALAAIFLTGTATAQTPSGPPSGVRAQMQQARDAAKTASFDALSADHQTKVKAIVDGFNAGALDAAAATAQIDAVLTQEEAAVVLEQQQSLRDARSEAMARMQAGQTGTPRTHGGSRTRTPDAGRFLLGLMAAPGKWRDAMRALRNGQDDQGSPP